MVPCCANYRHLQFDSGDLCKGQQGLLNRHEPVSIGNGAIIFELSKPRIAFHPLQDKAKLCEVHIKAPDGFGILAYVQEAYLRRNSSDMTCKDYIQFGQYDKLPFFTMEKSTPICGHVDGNRNFSKGFMYDDPHGHLLIWINLSGRQKTSHWPAIYTVNISLVLTAYQANCGTKKTSRSILKNVQPPKRGFNSCGVDPGPCISKDYFCDKRFNCVGETETERTHDELQCQYKAPASSSKSRCSRSPCHSQQRQCSQPKHHYARASRTSYTCALVVRLSSAKASAFRKHRTSPTDDSLGVHSHDTLLGPPRSLS